MFRGGDDTKSNGVPQEVNQQEKTLDGCTLGHKKRADLAAGPADDGECAGQPPAVGTGPVDPRTTSSGSKGSSSVVAAAPSVWFTSTSTAAWPISSSGCRTVVSGGSVHVISTL